MIKIENSTITDHFYTLDIGDTFIGGDNKYYIKIATATKILDSGSYGRYNAVCLTDGELAFVVEDVAVLIVNITGVAMTYDRAT